MYDPFPAFMWMACVICSDDEKLICRDDEKRFPCYESINKEQQLLAHQNHTVKPWNGGNGRVNHTCECMYIHVCEWGGGVYVCVCVWGGGGGRGCLHVNALACVPVHAYM